MKLSAAQLDALRVALDGSAYENLRIKFRTGESLRKLGLLDRLTITIASAVYVSRDHETDQNRGGVQEHDWHITHAGHAELRKRNV